MKNISVQILFFDYFGDETPFAIYVNGELETKGIVMTARCILDLLYKYKDCTFTISEYYVVDSEYTFPKHFKDIPAMILRNRNK